jgi:hypothetical protein
MSTNSAVTPFLLPYIFGAPSAAREIKFRKRYSRVKLCLFKESNNEFRITEADVLITTTKSQMKLLGSKKSGNTVLMQKTRAGLSCLK